jgi:hypothetical protein
MEIIKENWKMVVFIILAINLLSKLDDLNKNGRYVKVSDVDGIPQIMDTRNGKVYTMKSQKGKMPIWEQETEGVK